MKKRLIIGVFLCVALLQISISVSMIIKREHVLKHGARFKFEIKPVDPYDAFRGRYIALRIKRNTAGSIAKYKLNIGQKVYAFIGVDSEGFARVTAVDIARPKGVAYIQAKVSSISSPSNKVDVDLPIDRYYMEENAAPAAEKLAFWQDNNKGKSAYIVVRVKDGFAVIENLYIGDLTIEEAVKQGIKKP